MTRDEIDRILAEDDVIEPSSGFAKAVMDAVRQDAAEPPPLPFPWMRFAAGLVACTIAAAAATPLVARLEPAFGAIAPLATPVLVVAPELGYAALAVMAGLAAARLPRLLAKG